MNWHTTNKEMKILHQIALRAQKEIMPKRSLIDIEMDITATHLNGCKLRLNDLLKSDKFNFAHDLFGIANHIDRNTGKLTNCFLPRFSK